MVAFGQFLEILIGGLLSGVLYSLVALGFVLIFKASGVFNFAQGAMVLLAGLALVRTLDFLVAKGVSSGERWRLGWCSPPWSWRLRHGSSSATCWGLGPLVNQDGLTLFMSTIGITFVLEGISQMIFGADNYPLRLFPTDAWFLFESQFPGGILVSKLDVWGGLIAGILVTGLAVFFQRTRPAARCALWQMITQRHSPLEYPITWIWFVVWFVAGLVALVAATVWARSLGCNSGSPSWH